MQPVSDKRFCCGCETCAVCCPQHCIRMEEDEEGFRYPVTDRERCTGCGLCERICPERHPAAARTPVECHAARARDAAICAAGSSGGIFPLLAAATIRSGGVVFGAAFTPEGEVVHRRAETLEAIRPLLKSKYVQSRLDGVYAEVIASLREGRRVLFTGTPCQIAGLHALLRGARPEGLLTAECLCHGVPSPGLWRRYLREISGGRRILRIDFRDKSRSGWQHYRFTVCTEKGTRSIPARKDPYMKGFRRELTLRPSCYACPFKSGRSGSDLTLCDLWNVAEAAPQFDDDRGASLVLANTEAGAAHFRALDTEHAALSYDERVRARNGGFSEQVAAHPLRGVFFRELAAAGSVVDLLRRMVRPPRKHPLLSKLSELFHPRPS